MGCSTLPEARGCPGRMWIRTACAVYRWSSLGRSPPIRPDGIAGPLAEITIIIRPNRGYRESRDAGTTQSSLLPPTRYCPYLLSTPQTMTARIFVLDHRLHPRRAGNRGGGPNDALRGTTSADDQGPVG